LLEVGLEEVGGSHGDRRAQKWKGSLATQLLVPLCCLACFLAESLAFAATLEQGAIACSLHILASELHSSSSTLIKCMGSQISTLMFFSFEGELSQDFHAQRFFFGT
jgi:hypothetical protein